jgi:hypothetical protein
MREKSTIQIRHLKHEDRDEIGVRRKYADRATARRV